MSPCVIVTTNVAPRVRGFLASTLLEVAPCVYVGVISKEVVKRIWTILADWHGCDQGNVVMAHMENGHLTTKSIGTPAKTIVDCDGVLLAKRD